MTILRAAMLGALVLMSGSQALASDRDVFLSVLKRSGVTEDLDAGKKACLCFGGGAGGSTGLVTVYQSGGSYIFDCEVPYFDGQGNRTGSRLCIAWGGSFVVLPK